MVVVMYTDLLVGVGYLKEQEWEENTWEHGNLIEVNVPKGILEEYYKDRLADNYDHIPFEKWYFEESIADDMDGLFRYTDWRPFRADVVGGLW